MSRDDEILEELLRAAVSVAAAPPIRAGSNVHSAQVPWSRIRRLRAALEAADFDWRADKN
jgi:hypothetical protein